MRKFWKLREGETGVTLLQQLITGFETGRAIVGFQESSSLLEVENAFEIQDQLIQGLGWRVAAWKLGATTAQVKKNLGIDTQFWGFLRSEDVIEAPSVVNAADLRNLGIECEFGIVISKDFGAREKPYSIDEVVKGLGAVVPCIEIPQTRFSEIGVHGAHALIADNGAAGKVIIGTRWDCNEHDWQTKVKVNLSVNGDSVASGFGSEITDFPVGALLNHVNLVRNRWRPCLDGDVIATGSVTGFYNVRPGDRISADFGTLGRLDFELK